MTQYITIKKRKLNKTEQFSYDIKISYSPKLQSHPPDKNIPNNSIINNQYIL